MAELVWTQELRLQNRDVDMFRRLRLSRLFELLQEASVGHTSALGVGRARTLDRGLLWVVTRQWVDISRLPVYDEKIRVLTWPGESMHLFFPRQYRLESMEGEALLCGGALWMLVDAKTRGFVFPEKYGISIPGLSTPEDSPLPPAPKPLPTQSERRFTVPFSYVDMNGHMNNARYFDLLDDCLGLAAEGRALRSVTVEYKNEARPGEELTLRWGEEGQRCFFSGAEKKQTFTMSAEYYPQISEET